MINKRLVSLFLIAAMIFGIIGTVYADASGFADKLISKMLQFSADDRKNLLAIGKPMIATDIGIDEIVSQIKKYDPASDNVFNGIFGSFLAFTDKATATKAVKSIKLIDEGIRREYINSFEKRETLQLSANAMQAINYFIKNACNKYNGLETLMNDDGVNAAVVANMLKAIVDINSGKPLLTDSSLNKEDIGIYTVSPGLKNKANQFLIDNGMDSSNSLINMYLSVINTRLNGDEKFKIKQIGEEIGFYTPERETILSSLASGIGYQKDDTSIKYSIIKDKSVIPNVDFYAATIIEIALYVNDIKQEYGMLDEEYTIKIPVISDNTMAFKVADLLEPIKFSVCNNGELFIRINSTGYYGIKDMPAYFIDSDGWGSSYIESLYNRGIISGKGDNLFAPEDNVTREEFVKLVIELFEFDDDKYYMNFSDVSKDEWYYKYVAIAYKYGIINGVGDNRFGVGDKITRQDICKMLLNIINMKNIGLLPQNNGFLFKDSNEIADYAKDSVNNMHYLGIIAGDENGYFNPNSNATRQEAAKIIYGILELYVKVTLGH